MTKLKTIDIGRGKRYVEVSERLKFFRANYPDYSLLSDVVEITETTITIKATILDKKQNPIASGIAQEVKGSSFINKTSYVENCETSAWGRALANFGIGIDEAVASYNEVANAIEQQKEEHQIMMEGDKEEEEEDEFVLEKVLKGIEYYRKLGWEEKEIFEKIAEKYSDLDTDTIELLKEKSNDKAKPKKRNRKATTR
tara:strand:- start:93 stop:686 length:594 start_codon:yes stop_codon:yes gene_type:complete